MVHDSIYLENLNKEYKDSPPDLILRMTIEEIFKNKIAYVCSFGTESAIILHMISKIDRNFPVILINTNFLFKETIEYKNYLIEKLKLRNCKEIFPNSYDLDKNDKNGNLWKSSPDSCCNIRKVIPLKKELRNYQAWISGRKSYQKGERKFLKIFEFLNQKVVVNPLASVKKLFVDSYFDFHKINKHPLFTKGYLSIGCINCTVKSSNFDDPRSGRWTNNMKTECGIHYSYKK
tara:strand:- start:263 stop:961 length:699 start_codon:yes stop_codon:yes gene_type:complete